MKKKISKGWKVRLIAAFLLCLFPGTSCPGDAVMEPEAELQRVLRKAKEREKDLKTFVAAFEQNKKTILLEEPLHSSGMIFFDISGKMLLKMAEPEPFKILLKGGWITLFYPKWSKYEERYIGSDVFDKHFGIGRSLDDMAERFDMMLSRERPSGLYPLHLKPKSGHMEKVIQRIELLLDPKSWLPVSLSFIEKEGDVTMITLEFKALNEPLPEGIFDLELPDQR